MQNSPVWAMNTAVKCGVAVVLFFLCPRVNLGQAAPLPQIDVNLDVYASAIRQATWYRGGGDLQCGGGRPAAEDKSEGTANLQANLTLSAAGIEKSATVNLTTTGRGHSYTARSVTATAAIQVLDGVTSLRVVLDDAVGDTLSFDNKDDCGHEAGTVRTSSDRLRGAISLTFPGINGATAYAVHTVEATGRFKMQGPVLRGALHDVFTVDSNEKVVWMKLGQPTVLDFVFDDAYGRPPRTSVLTIETRPLGTLPVTQSTLTAAISSLPRRSASPIAEAELLRVIDVLMSASRDDKVLSAVMGSSSLKNTFDSLTELFRFEVWPLPGTSPLVRDLKVSARLVGFKMGKRLLQELVGYCDATPSIRAPRETSMVGGPTRGRLVSTALSIEERELKRFPIKELIAVVSGSSSAAEANDELARYFGQTPEGLGSTTQLLEDAVAAAPPGLMRQELVALPERQRKLARLQDRLLEGYRGRLFGAGGSSEGLLPPARELDTAVTEMIASIQRARSILDVDSVSTEGFSARLLFVDAHMVQLVRGDVDDYLARVSSAYLIDAQVRARLDRANSCLAGI